MGKPRRSADGLPVQLWLAGTTVLVLWLGMLNYAPARLVWHQTGRASLSRVLLQEQPAEGALGMTGAGQLPPEVLRHFVAATPTADFRHDLAKAMRGWRRGIRTLVLTNATGEVLAREQAEGQRFNERWASFPDHPGFPVTRKPGDPRAAMAPVLTAAQLGADFKWLLYGDDDVAFLWPGILQALQGLDPADPYFITDNYWSFWPTFVARPARPHQPRCLPCTFDDTGIDLKATHAFKTCNCTVAAMAEQFADLLTGRNQYLTFPRESPIFAMDGASGAILSAGLVRRLNLPLYESCVMGREADTGGPTKCGGGDCLVSRCIWHQGFGYTDPGFSLRHKGALLFNGFANDWGKMNRDASDALLGGCLGECQERLSSTVSMHVNGAAMADFGQSAVHLLRFLHNMALYATAVSPLQPLVGWLVL